MYDNEISIQLDLQFFAPKEGPGGERTEAATPKKLQDARKKGQVAKSRELTSSFELLALFLTLKLYAGSMGTRFMNMFSWIYSGKLPDFVDANRSGVTVQAVSTLFFYVIIQLILIMAPFLLAGFIISLFGDIIQVGWQSSTDPLKPDFNKINPANGFKRMFSKQSLFELFKSILKVIVIFVVAYINLKDKSKDIFLLYDIQLAGAVALIGNIIIDTGLKISILYIVVGLLDFIFQKRKFAEDMKMTKQEIKDEFKDTEGDPLIKQKQRQRMQEASQRRMMASVPEADVVITNPTHIAVALKYDVEENPAPVVVAKGEGYIAEKIKEKARENNIMISENKPLARALFATVEIGEVIPPELYEAVAEILALVYNMKK
jgi:flagellar biosynthetic protein FlhB